MTEKLTLWKRISNVMEESKAIPKNGYNDFHKYAYTMETDLVEGIRPLLVKHGLALTVTCDSIAREGDITTVGCIFTLTDVESEKSVSSLFYGTGQDKGDKGVFKAMTGATKYYLLKTFLIPTGNDPEEEGKGKKPKTQAEANAVQTRKPVPTDGPPNWSWFWTEAKKHLPEAEIRKRACEHFMCDPSGLATVVKSQRQLKEFLDTKILPK